jgi:hypothetical protein
MSEIKVEKAGAGKAGGRGRNNGRGGYMHKDKPVTPKTPEFEGRCDALKGFIFDCSDLKQTDLYNSTMKEIIGYVGREYSNGGGIKSTIENEKLYLIAIPDDPTVLENATVPNASAKRIWERQLDEYVRCDNRLTSNCQSAYSLSLASAPKSWLRD